MDALDEYLKPTWFLDSDSPVVQEYARRAVGDARTPREKAVRLFYSVRDGISYDPFSVRMEPESCRASDVATASCAFCVPKAVLLAAAARAVGIPSRLHFADLRNHLSSGTLRERMGTDLFVFHGYTELFLGGKWVKATPAFDLSLCERQGVRPVEFDGISDAIFHPLDTKGRRHMEYVRDRGSFADLPFEEMIRTLRETYGGEPSTANHP
jgi:transglutaminase-like putative cysteine protease